MKQASFSLFFIGLIALGGIIWWFGAEDIYRSITSLGVVNFVIIAGWQVLTSMTLGLAWFSLCPDIGLKRLFLSRMVRDAASSCLPFSQLGGIIIGIYATRFRVSARNKNRAVYWPEAVGANISDMTTEILGQVIFLLYGVVYLFETRNSPDITFNAVIGVGILALASIGFIWVQQKCGDPISRFVRFLSRHIVGQWSYIALTGIETYQLEIKKIWSRPFGIILSVLFHFCAWMLSGCGTWIALQFMGAEISLGGAIAIEAVASGIMSVFFLVPGALGVQEMTYVVLGHLFNVEPQISISLSLLRRARDMVIGVPVIVVWQYFDARSWKQATGVRSTK